MFVSSNISDTGNQIKNTYIYLKHYVQHFSSYISHIEKEFV